jgi:hypothetical protein
MLYSGQLLHLLSFSGLTRLIMVGHVQQTVVRYNGSTVSFLIKYPFRFSLHIYSFYKDWDESHVVYIIHVQSNSHYLFKEEANLLNQQINRPGLQTRNTYVRRQPCISGVTQVPSSSWSF